MTRRVQKLALATAAMLALLSIAGCAQYVGKGKAPPPEGTARGWFLFVEAPRGFALRMTGRKLAIRFRP
jgi:hypothetical protein